MSNIEKILKENHIGLAGLLSAVFKETEKEIEFGDNQTYKEEYEYKDESTGHQYLIRYEYKNLKKESGSIMIYRMTQGIGKMVVKVPKKIWTPVLSARMIPALGASESDVNWVGIKYSGMDGLYKRIYTTLEPK